VSAANTGNGASSVNTATAGNSGIVVVRVRI
jgi:hypothetical protein